MNNRICIIGVYFGLLPNYFGIWTKSAAFNQSIDFLVVSDQMISNLPSNVRTVSMSLDEMKSLAQRKLEMPDICLQRPYKCCDFRPAFGLIFEDYLRGYDYWGYCDFDMVFGDLNNFFTKYNLYSYDKFLTLGHLTLIRNTREVIERYKDNGSKIGYREVFCSDKSCLFDEIDGITGIYQANGYPQFTGRIFSDIASIHNRYRDIEEYPLDAKAQNSRHQVYYWENGHVYRNRFESTGVKQDEYIYMHFKRRPNFMLDFDVEESNRIIISNKGFFPCNEVPNREMADMFNPYHPLSEAYESVYTILRRLKHKIFS